jgi:N-acetylglucosamine malate deacetylase 1
VPFVDPVEIFRGVVVIAAPHMDDELLACGGTIASLPDKQRVHCVYATDGSKSPAPLFPWRGSIAPDLAATRSREAKNAMGMLGVPEGNLHFLQFPDGKLSEHGPELAESLAELLRRLRPSCVLMPFRYDRHPDHLALNRGAMRASEQISFRVDLFEYFVYYRWSLVPGNDIRNFIRPEQLLKIDIQKQAAQKQRALECYTSQTTLLAPWQDRPILPPQRLAEVSGSPECFLSYDPIFAGSKVFSHGAHWIRVAHLVEPFLKEQKERVKSLMRAGRIRHGSSSPL